MTRRHIWLADWKDCPSPETWSTFQRLNGCRASALTFLNLSHTAFKRVPSFLHFCDMTKKARKRSVIISRGTFRRTIQIIVFSSSSPGIGLASALEPELISPLPFFKLDLHFLVRLQVTIRVGDLCRGREIHQSRFPSQSAPSLYHRFCRARDVHDPRPTTKRKDHPGDGAREG